MKKQFDNIKFFEDEVYRFIDMFGLNDWEVYVDETEDNDIKGELVFDELDSNRTVMIFYSSSWLKDEKNKDEISKTAFHEVMELLLVKLRGYSNNKEFLISYREIDEEVHRIIRTLENVVFKLLK